VLVYNARAREDLTSPVPSTSRCTVDDRHRRRLGGQVIDVYPEDASAPVARRARGSAAISSCVRGEPFRGKFRDRLRADGAVRARQAAAISFDCRTSRTPFPRGHRLMVHVQSSWFPLIDRNPQVFMDIPAAKAADFQARDEAVWLRSAERPSSIRVLTLPKGS
jgi:predicted acyl esterase